MLMAWRLKLLMLSTYIHKNVPPTKVQISVVTKAHHYRRRRRRRRPSFDELFIGAFRGEKDI